MPSLPRSPSLPSLPAEAALSFLKDTKGTLTWSARDLADSLKISRREADQVLSLLHAQGYAQPASAKDQWLTTPSGETVSGAKPPRFTRERVEQALADLQTRIHQNNEDPNSPFRVTAAIAFGDFLLPDRARLQAADVGITLARRETPATPSRSRRTAASSSGGQRAGSSPNPALSTNPSAEPRSFSERNFLRQLRAKSALLALRHYAEWMRLRSHRSLC